MSYEPLPMVISINMVLDLIGREGYDYSEQSDPESYEMQYLYQVYSTTVDEWIALFQWILGNEPIGYEDEITLVVNLLTLKKQSIDIVFGYWALDLWFDMRIEASNILNMMGVSLSHISYLHQYPHGFEYWSTFGV